MKEIVCIENFFQESELENIELIIKQHAPGKDFIVPHGPFAGKLISNTTCLLHDKQLSQNLENKISAVVPEQFNIVKLIAIKLFFPWDVHSDYYIKECNNHSLPYYNFIVPLHNVNSRTIIFNEYTKNEPDFYLYKQNHDPVLNPIDQDFWQNNLSHCWAYDRQYLTLQHTQPLQRRGQLQGFPSRYFHSSDNFNKKNILEKHFLAIRTECKTHA